MKFRSSDQTTTHVDCEQVFSVVGRAVGCGGRTTSAPTSNGARSPLKKRSLSYSYTPFLATGCLILNLFFHFFLDTRSHYLRVLMLIMPKCMCPGGPRSPPSSPAEPTTRSRTCGTHIWRSGCCWWALILTHTSPPHCWAGPPRLLPRATWRSGRALGSKPRLVSPRNHHSSPSHHHCLHQRLITSCACGTLRLEKHFERSRMETELRLITVQFPLLLTNAARFQGRLLK